MNERNAARELTPLVTSMTVAVGLMGLVLGHGVHDAATPVPAIDMGTMTTIAAAPVVAPRRTAFAEDRREMRCLASAIWYEAGNQPHEGRVAVAEVVLSRMRSGIYPRRACAVIAQRSQFSFVRRGVIPAVPVAKAAEMTRIAVAVAEGRLRSRFKGALWFHAAYVDPGWTEPRLGQVGAHIFYGRKA